MDKKDDKKETSTLEGISLIVNMFLAVVWWGSAVLLLAVIMCGLVLWEPHYSLIALILLVGWVFFSRFHFNRYEKQLERQQKEYVLENITEYTTDGGKLGTLTFEYDKKRRMSRLKGTLPPIFVTDEVAVLTSTNERESGKFVESTVDRFFADRFLIYNGIINEFSRRADEAMNDVGVSFRKVLPTGVTLEDVSIEENSTKVFCKFGLIGYESQWYAEVSFVPNVIGYNIWIQFE